MSLEQIAPARAHRARVCSQRLSDFNRSVLAGIRGGLVDAEHLGARAEILEAIRATPPLTDLTLACALPPLLTVPTEAWQRLVDSTRGRGGEVQNPHLIGWLIDLADVVRAVVAQDALKARMLTGLDVPSLRRLELVRSSQLATWATGVTEVTLHEGRKPKRWSSLLAHCDHTRHPSHEILPLLYVESVQVAAYLG